MVADKHRFLVGGPAYTGGLPASGGTQGDVADDGGRPLRIQQPVEITAGRGYMADASGYVATVGVSQIVLLQDPHRRYILIQNVTAASTLWLNFGGPASAAAGSFVLAFGDSMVFEGTFIPTQSMSAFASVIATFYTCKVAGV